MRAILTSRAIWQRIGALTPPSSPFHAESSRLCELSHIRGRSTANTLSATGVAMRTIKGNVKMSREFDSSRIEQFIMLGGLALFLLLATIMPA
jgi:hypothetical protein